MTISVTGEQAAICARFGIEASGVGPEQIAGVAWSVRSGLVPVNGLRHEPAGDTSGWYIWAGEELSDDPGFFVPLHVEHLTRWRPEVVPYLALPPGWRFLLAPGHEDVWHDGSLLLA